MKSFTSTHLMVAAVVALLGGGFLGYMFGYDIGWERSLSTPVQNEPTDLSITNFDDCAAAGYPIMESFPRQCRTQGGRMFVEDVAVTPTPPTPSPSLPPKVACARAGCSSQLCVEAGQAGGMVTTCEFRPEYACYRTARCERQATGACGWTTTPALTACLANPPSE